MTRPTHIILLRFSAMGDVALLLPVVVALSRTYPEAYITVVTRPRLTVFFDGLPNVSTIGADIDTEYKGIFGLWRLYRIIKNHTPYSIDKNKDSNKDNNKSKINVAYRKIIIDLHDNLRTNILRRFFQLAAVPTYVFDKGRAEKKQILNRTRSLAPPLAHTTERYAAACAEVGFKVQLPTGNLFDLLGVSRIKTSKSLTKNLTKSAALRGKINIGFAPFAKHDTKKLPFSTVIAVVAAWLEEQPETVFYFFGAGAPETELMRSAQALFPIQIIVVQDICDSLQPELALIAQLDAMIAMDSLNLHLAALSNVPTVSVWGATHTAFGFGAYGAQPHRVAEVSAAELGCRPCAVFGDKPCHRGDTACMQRLDAEDIIVPLKVILQNK